MTLVETRTTAADWYRRSYPEAPEHTERCLFVLNAWMPLHNIPRTGRNRTDGGFRKIYDGVEVHLRAGFGCLSTFDMDGLTRLVLAAHQYCCRVEVSAEARMLIIQVHPRTVGAEHLFERHPDLDDLIATASAMRDADMAPKCQGCGAPLSCCGSCEGGTEQ